ncbi:MAG: ATP-grasp domain-containing protein [Bacteroidales bacterium]
MESKLNILFLGGARRTSLAERFIGAGKKLGKKVDIFSYELMSEVPLIAVARKIIIGKRWNDPQILDHLKSIIADNNIHIVLPFVDPAVEVLARLKTEYHRHDLAVPVSDLTVAQTFFDKVCAQQWFIKHGFPVPEAKDSYPIIAKPRKGSAAKGLAILQNDQQKATFFQNHSPDDYLLQAYLEADEYTVDAYVSIHERKILGMVPRQRIEVFNGEVIKSVTVRDEEILSCSEKILMSAPFEGPITLQYLRERKTGKLYIMEINPRFGGGVINSIEAGFDIPLLLLQEYMHIPVKPIANWQENLVMMRTFKEIFVCR